MVVFLTFDFLPKYLYGFEIDREWKPNHSLSGRFPGNFRKARLISEPYYLRSPYSAANGLCQQVAKNPIELFFLQNDFNRCSSHLSPSPFSTNEMEVTCFLSHLIKLFYFDLFNELVIIPYKKMLRKKLKRE